MFLRTISAAVALAASGLVSAQTSTKCNPLYTSTLVSRGPRWNDSD